MYKKLSIFFFIVSIFCALLFFVKIDDEYNQVALVDLPFTYSFNVPGVLEEANSMARSASPYWWLNSGGVMSIREGSGRTNQEELPSLSKWRVRYRITNPEDTDQGYHPQNIFRLISRNSWQDSVAQIHFMIKRDNLSQSANRNISNGVLLMSRYQDGDNLYYLGLRVDGTAVIKRKRGGEYVTLAQEKIFEGEYERENNPNLIPKDKWIGIQAQVENISSGAVSLKLLVDLENDGTWTEVLETIDTGGNSPTETPILISGFSGIITDFMDVEFRDFVVRDI